MAGYTVYPQGRNVGTAEPKSNSISWLKPYNTQAITTFGEPEYKTAYANWGTQLAEYKAKMSGLYQPESYAGYGEGLRQEAKETVQGGVATDIGKMIASGMSSEAGAGGLGTRATSELSKLYKNIRDTQVQLASTAAIAYNQSYAQLMAPLASLMAAQPEYGRYVQPVTTTKQGYSWV